MYRDRIESLAGRGHDTINCIVTGAEAWPGGKPCHDTNFVS